MPNCLTLLAVATALSTSMVDRVDAHSLTLINCASGTQRAFVDSIQPGTISAGIVMPDAERARRRATLVTQSSMVDLIAPNEDSAVVLVTKKMERVQNGDTVCVIFSGAVDAPPLPPTVWTARGHR